MAPVENIEGRLRKLGIQLPQPPQPVGKYVAVQMQQGLGLVSGQFPLVNGGLVMKGPITRYTDTKLARLAVRGAAVNVLSQIRNALGSWDALVGLGRLDAYFNCTHDFYDHASLLDEASDLFTAVLGDRGAHARSVCGVSSLPFQAPVELVVQFFYKMY